jgi:uncharacterized coiled-coil DUF342 family protein
MEEVLKQILEKIIGLEESQRAFEAGQKILKAGQNEIRSEITGIKDEITGIKDEIKELNRKIDTIYEQTANLTEFKTEIIKLVKNHELDIRLLKQLVVK